jgi:hypothetical protein
MQIAQGYDLTWLISKLDDILCRLKWRDSEQGEGDSVIAVKELMTVASDMLEKLVNTEIYYSLIITALACSASVLELDDGMERCNCTRVEYDD